MLILGIAIAGALGAITRFLLDEVVQRRTHTARPLGTLVINTSGSLILGVLTGLALYHALPADAKTVLGTGFCGAYTTFSTFSYQTVRLARRAKRSTSRVGTSWRACCCRRSPRGSASRSPRCDGAMTAQ